MKKHYCASEGCPGYSYKASERAHPVETCSPNRKAWLQEDNWFFDPIAKYMERLKRASEKAAGYLIFDAVDDDNAVGFEVIACAVVIGRDDITKEIRDRARADGIEISSEQMRFLIFWYEYHVLKHFETRKGIRLDS